MEYFLILQSIQFQSLNANAIQDRELRTKSLSNISWEKLIKFLLFLTTGSFSRGYFGFSRLDWALNALGELFYLASSMARVFDLNLLIKILDIWVLGGDISTTEGPVVESEDRKSDHRWPKNGDFWFRCFTSEQWKRIESLIELSDRKNLLFYLKISHYWSSTRIILYFSDFRLWNRVGRTSLSAKILRKSASKLLRRKKNSVVNLFHMILVHGPHSEMLEWAQVR